MPFYQGTRRSLLSAGSFSYAPKSFNSGGAEVTTFNFQGSVAQATYTFNSGVTGGSPTIWTLTLSPGSGINPGDSFTFGYDGFNNVTYWFQVDGSGSNSGFMVAINSTDTASQVCTALASVVTTPGFFQSAGDTMTYNSTNYESQSTPSTGSYGSVSVINSGSPDPGTVGGVVFFAPNFGTNFGVYFWAAYSNGFDPGGQGGAFTGVQVSLSGNYSDTDLATVFVNAINSSTYNSIMFASAVGNVMTISASTQGQVSSGSTFGSVISISQTQIDNGFYVNNWSPSSYILVYDFASGASYYAWMQINGSGSDPLVGNVAAMVAVSTSDDVFTIAQNIGTAFSNFGVGFGVSSGSGTLAITAPNFGHPSAPSSTNPPFSLVVNPAGFTNVDVSSSTITLPGYNFPTGLAVRLTTTSTLPSPLSTGVTYYMIAVTSSTLKLASSKANALLGDPISLTTTGSGIQTIRQYP